MLAGAGDLAMRRQMREWLLGLVKKLFSALLQGEAWVVEIVLILMPALLILAWLWFRAYRKDAETRRRLELGEPCYPPSAEEVARIISPKPVEPPGAAPAPENQRTHDS